MSHKGNILLVANWESDVGYAWWLMECFWVSISKHFSKKGVQVFLIYPAITTIPERISKSNISTLELDFSNHTIKNLKLIRNLIRDNNIQHIYLTDSPSRSSYYLLLRLWGIKKIVVHDHTPGDRTIPEKLKSLLKSIVQSVPYLSADHFIAVSKFVYNRLVMVSRIPERKCSCVPNGIHPINLAECDLNYSHETFCINRDKMIVVTTGRATYYKGIDFFIECANILVNEYNINNLHFLYCGDGPDLHNFKSLVANYKIDKYFTFAGKRDDVRAILASCDIGFHASKGEVGYSLSILEYMSAGLATIVPDLPSTSEAIRHTETGLLYEYRNTTSACDAIIKCTSPDLRKMLSTNAIADVHERFNIKNTRNQVIRILDRVLYPA